MSHKNRQAIFKDNQVNNSISQARIKLPKIPTPKTYKGIGTVFRFRTNQYSKEVAERTAQKINQEMKKAGVNGGIQVNLLYPSRWHSNRITKIGHEVDVHSHEFEYPEEGEPE